MMEHKRVVLLGALAGRNPKPVKAVLMDGKAVLAEARLSILSAKRIAEACMDDVSASTEASLRCMSAIASPDGAEKLVLVVLQSVHAIKQGAGNARQLLRELPTALRERYGEGYTFAIGATDIRPYEVDVSLRCGDGLVCVQRERTKRQWCTERYEREQKRIRNLLRELSFQDAGDDLFVRCPV